MPGKSVRRRQPQLILSQDYELFFHKSGTVEKCLIEPSAMLVNHAAERDLKITFFVDAGMLLCMERYGRQFNNIRTELSKVRSNIEMLARAGHEIALHVHPHWEDTAWKDGRWCFSGSRYQLSSFTDTEANSIVERYATALASIGGEMPRSYRAGGFCIHSFSKIGATLARLGINIDSSVVPGARLHDAEKGFDFRKAPRAEYWTFEVEPLRPETGGRYLELPLSVVRLPLTFYWARAIERTLNNRSQEVIGDGLSKPIGRKEVLRRLAGIGRISEMSTDHSKAPLLTSRRVLRSTDRLFNIMGHPKLLSRASLDHLDKFMLHKGIRSSETLGATADLVRTINLSAQTAPALLGVNGSNA